MKPEEKARQKIDHLLMEAGWKVQDRKELNLSAGVGVAVREYYTDVGPADYILFVDRKPIGVIEAKKEEEGYRLTQAEEQSSSYAASKLKHLNNNPLPFVYESTGTLTRFTDYRDPKPRSRPVFTFRRPETFREGLKKPKSLRDRLLDLPDLPRQGLLDCQITATMNLESSLKANKPRALIQMATGSGKTFAAITAIYRLLKFADAKPAAKKPWTKEIWYYDYRTNIHHTLKKNPLKLEDLRDFIHCYESENRHIRKDTWHPETNPEGQWRKFTYDEIINRDKTSLDIFWLRDKSLADLDNLPDPDELANDIIENLEAAVESFKEIAQRI